MRVLLLLTIVALAGCSSRSDEVEEPRPVSISDQIGDWSATVEPRNNSGIRGTVSVHSAVAVSVVRISISGATADNHHPWHVHRGSCDSGGPIVGDSTAYAALHVDAAGNASAASTIGTALLDEDKYHVNVHRSPTELDVIVACGNLKN